MTIKDIVKETVQYEAHITKETFKNTVVWMYIVAFVALFFALNNRFGWVIFLLIIEIILQSKHHYESGEVTAHSRNVKNIPNKTDIRNLKEATQK